MFCLSRKNGRVGFSFGGGGVSGTNKVILTLDDLVFINTQVSKRVSSLLNLMNLNPDSAVLWFA